MLYLLIFLFARNFISGEETGRRARTSQLSRETGGSRVCQQHECCHDGRCKWKQLDFNLQWKLLINANFILNHQSMLI